MLCRHGDKEIGLVLKFEYYQTNVCNVK